MKTNQEVSLFGRGPFGWVVGIVLVLAIVAGAAALGYWAYNAGVANGLAQGGSSGAPVEPGAVAPYFYAPYGFRHYGFGFGPLGCLIPLLFFFLIFGAMRMLFWPRRWGWGPGGWGGHRHEEWPGWMRERAEEWHRQMHGEAPERPADAEK
jgi:hypothetical protein